MSAERLAVWLYGSRARGDEDGLSDLDVFVVDAQDTQIDDLQAAVPTQLDAATISRYSWPEIHAMAKYGSLFLHHLRLEGSPLYESPSCIGTLSSILATLGDYQHASRDLEGFRTVLADVRESLATGGVDVFEMSVLATVIRHCSILGCWLLGQPSFGRTEPVVRIVATLRLATSISVGFPALYKYRLYSDKRLDRSCLPTGLSVDKWLGRAEALVSNVEDLAHERRH